MRPFTPDQRSVGADIALFDASYTAVPRLNETPSLERLSQSGIPLTLRGGCPEAPLLTEKRRRQLLLKRGMDIVLASIALVILSVPLLCVALAVKLTSRGPVLFKQRRVGLDGQCFEMLKFRTVREEESDPHGHRQVVAKDRRLTPIGAFLRNTSVDELPQLINIVKGDMSVIGPRPMVEGMRAGGQDYRDVVPYYDFRHSMKPGLSGWAQANGLRGPTDDLGPAIARVQHDCAYVQNFSIGLDIAIIFKTLRGQFLTGSGI